MAGLSQVVVQVGQASLANAMWLSNFGVLLFKPLPGKKAVTESPIPLYDCRSKNSAVAARVLSICASLCVVEIKPASNCDGAM